MNILIIANNIPYPPQSGAQVRLYNLLRRMAVRHDVWLATHLHSPEQIGGVAHLQTFCRGVATALLREQHAISHLPGLARYALTGRPPELKFLYSDELAGQIRRFLTEADFDIVAIDESRMALYQELLPPHHPRRILTFYDIGYHQSARIAAVHPPGVRKIRAWLHARLMRAWEPRYAGKFDRCVVVSELDRTRLLARNPTLRVDVIPNGVDTGAYEPLPRRKGRPALLFVGAMHYAPSGDAVLHFCREIWPIVQASLPEVEMWVVGASPPPQLKAEAGNNLHVTGRVDDIRPYYARSDVSVVPIRAGGGTRLKILEAMALGRPVVSTPVGCEGLDVTAGQHLLIADEPRLFAEGILRLLNDHSLYQSIAASARQLVELRYDWDAIAGQLMRVLARTADPSPEREVEYAR